jgi:UDP-2,3-diacylglucosamine pyrophosphatase LpxH
MRPLIFAFIVLLKITCDFGDVLAGDARNAVFISDLHLGVGKGDQGKWDPTEDFRWSDALAAFLDRISAWGNGKTDLIIIGDLLELWQPPIPCSSADPDRGCSAAELEATSKTVVQAHSADLLKLAEFARKGANHLYIVPGNHDAALLLKPIWKQVADAMNLRTSDRISLIEEGIWKSKDGRVVAEHGHQIGGDVNAYPSWPRITEGSGSDEYIRRPWGELFVQKLYNDREKAYPIIDNLSPESAGVRYYMADRGIAGSIGDVGKFLWFNLFETSWSQRGRSLGTGSNAGVATDWNPDTARELGHKLFAGALAKDDPFRIKLLSDSTQEWGLLRKSLDKTVRDKEQFNDDQIKMLCNYLAIRGKEVPDNPQCSPKLGAAIQAIAVPMDWVMRAHLDQRLELFPKMQIFIYAHTHALWFDWHLPIGSGRSVDIFNTGAFQRLIDDDQFKTLARSKGLTPSEAMQKLGLDELPACYSAVFLENDGKDLRAEVKNWYFDKTSSGELLGACDTRCAQVSEKCRN